MIARDGKRVRGVKGEMLTMQLVRFVRFCEFLHNKESRNRLVRILLLGSRNTAKSISAPRLFLGGIDAYHF
jgi:hypothetical protein